ncbi:MAG: ABC transporter permease [Acetobacteraceae bacterium]
MRSVARLPARIPTLLVGLVVALAVIYLVAPIIVVVMTSFTSTGYLAFPPHGFSLRWYGNIGRSQEFINGFLTSVALASCAVSIVCAIGIPAAIGLYRSPGMFSRALGQLFLSPLVLPAVVFGVGYLVALHRAGYFGTFAGALLAHCVLTTPFVVRSVGAGLAEIDPAYEDAAQSLGASPLRGFFRVTLPLMRSSIIVGAIFAFIISFDETVVTLFLVGPHFNTLPVRIFTYIQYSDDPTIAAISTALVLMSILILFVVSRVTAIGNLV